MNRKVEPFKQYFYENSVRCQKLQQVFEEQSFGLDTGPQRIRDFLLMRYINLRLLTYLLTQ